MLERIEDYVPSTEKQPAWTGCALQDFDLVLEGGSMRGLFTAGVLSFFQDQGLFPVRVIGVSAGALNAFNYRAGDAERTLLMNAKYCTDWRYLSMKSYIRTGNALGNEFVFDKIPNELEPFNYDAFDSSPIGMVSVASDLVCGDADYHEH